MPHYVQKSKFKNMNFFCVYVKTRKKMDKYIKVNKVKNKYIIDIKKIIEEEELSHNDDKTYLKIIIFNKKKFLYFSYVE